jgi:hypothetical protein
MLYLLCYKSCKPGRLRNGVCKNSVYGPNDQRSRLYRSRATNVTEEGNFAVCCETCTKHHTKCRNLNFRVHDGNSLNFDNLVCV